MTGSATALGRLIVTVVALALIVAGIAAATPLAGTVWPLLLITAGLGLAARLIHIAAKESR